MKLFRSSSSSDTRKIAARAARSILRRPRKVRQGAIVIGLSGDLGSGKTTFVQGFLRALGSRSRAVSPTFLLIRRIPVKRADISSVFHVDVYRLRRPEEILRVGFRDILNDPWSVILVEWGDRIKKLLPRGSGWVSLVHGSKPNERFIRVKI